MLFWIQKRTHTPLSDTPTKFLEEQILRRTENIKKLTYVSPLACFVQDPDVFNYMVITESEFQKEYPNAKGVKLGEKITFTSNKGTIVHSFCMLINNAPAHYVRLEDGSFVPLALFIAQFNKENNCYCWLSEFTNFYCSPFSVFSNSDKYLTKLVNKLNTLTLFNTDLITTKNQNSGREFKEKNPNFKEDKQGFGSAHPELMSQRIILLDDIQPDWLVVLGRDGDGTIQTISVRGFWESFGCELSQLPDGQWQVRNKNFNILHIAAIEFISKAIFFPKSSATS